jgi:hypothetical protein
MIYAVQDYPLAPLLVGFVFSVIGLVLIVFHRSVKEWRDDRNSRDFPIGYGEMWTGKYTKGGLIFTYGLIILAGAIFLILGVGFIVSAVRG